MALSNTHRSGLLGCLEPPDRAAFCWVLLVDATSGTQEHKHVDIQSFRMIQALVDEPSVLSLGSKDIRLSPKRQFERTSSFTGASIRRKWGSGQLL